MAKLDEFRYLICVSDDIMASMKDGRAQGRVLDLEKRVLYPPTNIHSILARGGWVDYLASQEQLEKWLAQVTIMDDFPKRERKFHRADVVASAHA